MSLDIHPATWRFLRGLYREWYAPRPELTLTDWLSDMRRAHAALPGEDVRIDLMLEQSIAVLEHTIDVRGGRLPPELTDGAPPRRGPFGPRAPARNLNRTVRF